MAIGPATRYSLVRSTTDDAESLRGPGPVAGALRAGGCGAPLLRAARGAAVAARPAGDARRRAARARGGARRVPGAARCAGPGGASGGMHGPGKRGSSGGVAAADRGVARRWTAALLAA